MFFRIKMVLHFFFFLKSIPPLLKCTSLLQFLFLNDVRNFFRPQEGLEEGEREKVMTEKMQEMQGVIRRLEDTNKIITKDKEHVVSVA